MIIKTLANGNSLIIGRQPFPMNLQHRDPWPIHAIQLIESGVTGNAIGQFMFMLEFKLLDNSIWYYSPSISDDYTTAIAWNYTYNQSSLPDTFIYGSGEFWNYRIRPFVKFKLDHSQFHQWQLGNFP